MVSALVVGYCVILLLRQRRRPLSRRAAVVLGLPVAGLAVAAMGAASPAAGLGGMARYLQVFVLVPAAVLVLLRGRADFRLLAWSFVGLAVWQGAVGVHQYVTGTGASYQGETVRAVGTFGAQDVMGMATAVALGVVCATGLALGRTPLWQRAAAAVCAVVLLVPLAVSFSRGAWIATALTCAVQLTMAGLRRALKVAAAVAAAGVILVGGLGVGTAMLQERIDSITQVADAPDQSVTDRYTLWGSAVGMWREQPLTGVGLKNFPSTATGTPRSRCRRAATSRAPGDVPQAGVALPAQHVPAGAQRAGAARLLLAGGELAGAAGVRGARARRAVTGPVSTAR